MAKKKQNKQALVSKLRFPEFQEDGEWDRLNGNKLFGQINDRNHNGDLPVLAITQEHGAIPRNLIDYNVSVSQNSVKAYKIVRVGDFIISLRSFQGGIEYSNYEGICSPAYVVLREKRDTVPAFFKHLFKSSAFIRELTKNLEGLRDGKMISYKQFSEVLINLPSKSEQQKIADCLGSLDDLIAAHNAKLDALQDHKKGLLQQLFPAEGQTTQKLRFPEFENAEQWKITPFKKVVSNSFYGTSKSTSEKGEFVVLRMGNMNGGKISFSKVVYIDLTHKEFKKLKLQKGDILLNRTNSYDLVGKVSLFDSNIDCITASYIVTYRLNKDVILPEYCNYLFNTPAFQAKIRALATPSISQWNINPTRFKNELNIFLPIPEEQKAITSCLNALDGLITAHTELLNTFEEHKKGLMQQLFPNPELCKK